MPCNMPVKWQGTGIILILVHNYDPPLNYAADAVAFSSINNSMEQTEDKLKRGNIMGTRSIS